MKEENAKLKSENEVLTQYIENLMASSTVIQSSTAGASGYACVVACVLQPRSSHAHPLPSPTLLVAMLSLKNHALCVYAYGSPPAPPPLAFA